MVRTWWRTSPRPVDPTSLWARRSTWKLSFARSPTRVNRRVQGSESLEWSVSFEHDMSLFAGNTAQAVGTLFRFRSRRSRGSSEEAPFFGLDNGVHLNGR